MNPDKTLAHQKNAELLRLTFNTINGVIKEFQNKTWTGESHCDMFTLAAAAKIIYQRWEAEKRALRPEDLPSIDFCPPSPLPTPPIPEGRSREVAEAIQKSVFFKTVWGNVSKK